MTEHPELTAEAVQGWAGLLSEVEQQIRPYFARSEARQRAIAYLQGLLSPVERKNSWQLAEVMGAATPYGFQHLLGRADWDAEALRDELRRYVLTYLGDDGAIAVIDETGFLKKGYASVGVARQYSGTAGRIENCQIGVFLTYRTPRGHTLLDRELYLPQEWTDDPERCRQGGVPNERTFQTKPQLARRMLERLFNAQVPLRWVTGDSIYGDDRRLRLWLEEQDQAYVLGVSGKDYVWQGWKQHRVKTLLANLPTDGWQRLSAGNGAKGPRWYDWLLIPIGAALQEPGRRGLLVRRSVSDPQDVTAFVVFAPLGTPLTERVRVAGSRWATEIAFEEAKGEVGLDQYEVRSWAGWYRHVTLALWAQAILAVARAQSVQPVGAPSPKKGALRRLPRGRRSRRSSLAAFKAQRGL